ncbi:hypothetical protein QJS10_CPA05g01035 [Acorus calamus]|uniref:Uncharacterized protein n=1 Tax=Acorus calamus TaxID=4465 RepID=A0AAV9ES89_ACOCL|nr:hypothetical protein QJS10_CPA05g01035 [Acorus calamus]
MWNPSFRWREEEEEERQINGDPEEDQKAVEGPQPSDSTSSSRSSSSGRNSKRWIFLKEGVVGRRRGLRSEARASKEEPLKEDERHARNVGMEDDRDDFVSVLLRLQEDTSLVPRSW